MKKLFFVMLSVALGATGFAQSSGRIGNHDATTSWTPSAQTNFAAPSEAKLYIQQIMNAIGLKPNFEIMPARIDNAAAVTYAGKRFVLYNPTFINSLVKQTGNKWAAVSVLAHEIGHHLNGHTVTMNGSQPATELEADEFSGFVLHKMGASLADAQAAMKLLAGRTASRTHPAQHDRLTSIAKGWQQSAGKITSDVAITTPQTPANTMAEQRPAVQPPVTVTSNRNSTIIGTVRFDANPSGRYFVTANYSLVQVEGQQAKAIARIAKVRDSRFPYMIYDAQNTRLLVTTDGAIINSSGKTVGRMQAYNG